MKRVSWSTTPWWIVVNFSLLLVLSLSCCRSSDNGQSASSSADPAAASGRPVTMVEALARGKAENKVVMIELFDVDCVYCQMMMETWEDAGVQEATDDVIYAQIIPTDAAVIEEFDMFQSPTFLFFKPDGTFIDPYFTGFRQAELFIAEIENYKLMAAGMEPGPFPEDNHPDFGKG